MRSKLFHDILSSLAPVSNLIESLRDKSNYSEQDKELLNRLIERVELVLEKLNELKSNI